MPFPPLLTLHSDVLLIILSHLLIDAPRSPTTAAILRTCSALHSLGHPFLYEIIDLTGIKEGKHVVEAWEGLFGEEKGLLTENGRLGAGFGRRVRELRLGGSDSLGTDDWDEFTPSQTLSLTLPRLTSLTLHSRSLGRFNAPHILGPLITQFPLRTLIMFFPYKETHGDTRHTEYLFNPSARRRNESLEQALLDLPNRKQPAAWEGLETIVHQESIWYLGQRLFLSTWGTKKIVFEHLVATPETPEVVDAIVEGTIEKEDDDHQEGMIMSKVERFELRVDKAFESEFRRYAAMRGVGGSEMEQETLRRRLCEEVVFVATEDGKERWLVPRKGEARARGEDGREVAEAVKVE